MAVRPAGRLSGVGAGHDVTGASAANGAGRARRGQRRAAQKNKGSQVGGQRWRILACNMGLVGITAAAELVAGYPDASRGAVWCRLAVSASLQRAHGHWPPVSLPIHTALCRLSRAAVDMCTQPTVQPARAAQTMQAMQPCLRAAAAVVRELLALETLGLGRSHDPMRRARPRWLPRAGPHGQPSLGRHPPLTHNLPNSRRDRRPRARSCHFGPARRHSIARARRAIAIDGGPNVTPLHRSSSLRHGPPMPPTREPHLALLCSRS